MKTDAYTKVVLTGIAIFLGFIAFDYKPTINAQAASSGVPQTLASATKNGGVWWLWNDKIKLCYNPHKEGYPPGVECSGWVQWKN
jgi:hypothetical protein